MRPVRDILRHPMAAEVTLFIPCVVDQVYPEMWLAMVEVLEHPGFYARYDPRQPCCGPPAFQPCMSDRITMRSYALVARS